MKIFKNFYWLLIEKSLKILSTFIVISSILKLIGPISFGKMSYAMAYVEIFSFLFLFGTDNSILQFLKLENHQRTLSDFFNYRLLLSLFGLSVTVISNYFFKDTAYISLVVIFALAKLLLSINIFDFYFQFHLMGDKSSRLKIFNSAIFDICRIAIAIFHPDIIFLAMTYVIENFCLLFLYRNLSQLVWTTTSFENISLITRSSFFFALTSLAISLYTKLDQIMIEHYLGLGELGRYSIIIRFTEVWGFIPMTISYVSFSFLRTHQNSDSNFRKYFQNFMSLTAVLSISIILFLFISADWLIAIITGTKDPQLAQMLRVKALVILPIFTGGLIAQVFALKGFGRKLFVVTAITTLFNVTCNFIFLKNYGLWAATWISVISYFIPGFLGLILFRETRSLIPYYLKGLFLPISYKDFVVFLKQDFFSKKNGFIN